MANKDATLCAIRESAASHLPLMYASAVTNCRCDRIPDYKHKNQKRKNCERSSKIVLLGEGEAL